MNYLQLLAKYPFDIKMEIKRVPGTECKTTIYIGIASHVGYFSEKMNLFDEDDKLMQCLDVISNLVWSRIKEADKKR